MPASSVPSAPRVIDSRVTGVRLHELREVKDARGDLCVAEVGADLRGAHAHRRCGQFLQAVAGSVHVIADDGRQREEFCLDRPSLGLYLPPMTWGIQHRYTQGAVLLVLASDPYDPADYIRDYDEFLALRRAGGAA